MPERICKGCHKKYEVDNIATDDGYCSFECWEKENCETPELSLIEEYAD